eukprot:UN03919
MATETLSHHCKGCDALKESNRQLVKQNELIKNAVEKYNCVLDRVDYYAAERDRLNRVNEMLLEQKNQILQQISDTIREAPLQNVEEPETNKDIFLLVLFCFLSVVISICFTVWAVLSPNDVSIKKRIGQGVSFVSLQIIIARIPIWIRGRRAN